MSDLPHLCLPPEADLTPLLVDAHAGPEWPPLDLDLTIVRGGTHSSTVRGDLAAVAAGLEAYQAANCQGLPLAGEQTRCSAMAQTDAGPAHQGIWLLQMPPGDEEQPPAAAAMAEAIDRELAGHAHLRLVRCGLLAVLLLLARPLTPARARRVAEALQARFGAAVRVSLDGPALPVGQIQSGWARGVPGERLDDTKILGPDPEPPPRPAWRLEPGSPRRLPTPVLHLDVIVHDAISRLATAPRDSDVILAGIVIDALGGTDRLVYDRNEMRRCAEDGAWHRVDAVTVEQAVSFLDGMRVLGPKGASVVLDAKRGRLTGIAAQVRTQVARPGFFEAAPEGVAFLDIFFRVAGKEILMETLHPDHRVAAEHVLPWAFVPDSEKVSPEESRFAAFIDEVLRGVADAPAHLMIPRISQPASRRARRAAKR